jgi:hypothetical protein
VSTNDERERNLRFEEQEQWAHFQNSELPGTGRATGGGIISFRH